ncbi:MAG: hypothetical protein KAV18_03935 [Candidatus Omnitrophica bacterium]|nr:hypothetical protein [Candidatus Omnitrophota bacterium]
MKTKKRTLKEYQAESNLLNKEFSGAVEKTKSLTGKDKKWLHEIIESESPKIPVTIRLASWQIERAKQIAKEKHVRGYQTLIRQILSKALL